MTDYSLLEYKLRRYFYLGNEYNIYVPPGMRRLYWHNRHQDDVTGVRIIGKIVKKNIVEDINSIVPIILKVKKEDKLYDDRFLIYALAVCAKFDTKECKQMIEDAYEAITIICTDGLKLLTFVSFCRTASNILHNEGFIDNVSLGFGKGYRRGLQKWYLERDPMLTTEQILRHRSYNGWSHKDVLKLTHIYSKDPRRLIFIYYILYGMKKVEELFGNKLKDMNIADENVTYEETQLKFIYTKIKQVNDLGKMDETTLLHEIELRRLGRTYEVIPKNMLENYTILTGITKHVPLQILLDNTFFYAKRKLFHNVTPSTGLWEFILRFNNLHEVKNYRLHPIESYLQYVKYSRMCQHIIQIQNNILEKRGSPERNADKDDLKVILKKEKKKKKIIDNKTELNDENPSNYFPIEVWNKDDTTDINDVNDNENNQSNMVVIMRKPPPSLVVELKNFLSEGLVEKTLQNLNPIGKRMLIGYDSRQNLGTKMCLYSDLISVREAITLIILSLIYPEKMPNKPTICGLFETGKKDKAEIQIDYRKPLNVANLDKVLYNTFNPSSSEDDINPVTTIRWAIKKQKEFDIFVFLGTNKMNFKNIRAAVKEYHEFLKKPMKIIVCCLNGKHLEQRNLSHYNFLFIAGFDKNVGKIIDSFIKGEF